MSSLSHSRHARRTGQPIKAMKPDKATECANKLMEHGLLFRNAVSPAAQIIRQFYPEESPDSIKITLEKPRPDTTKSEGSDLSFID